MHSVSKEYNIWVGTGSCVLKQLKGKEKGEEV
jgi:hypothetical protein